MRATVFARAALVALGLVCAGGFARAQDARPAAAAKDAEAAFDELMQEFTDGQQAFYTAYRAATTDEEREKAFELRPELTFAPRFHEFAEAYSDTEQAARALVRVVQLGPGSGHDDMADDALDTLLADYMDYEALGELASNLQYAGRELGEERVVESLRKLLAESLHGSVRAASLFSLASLLSEKEDAAARKEARALFQRLLDEYGELEGRRGKTWAQVAEGSIFQFDRLQVGMPVPDIEGTDLNGVSFKLSDYQGKVVLIDFWGNW